MTTQYDIECYIEDAVNEGLAKGFEKGLEQGLEKGLEQGLQQGQTEGKDEAQAAAIIKALKHGKLTLEEIAEYNDVPIEKVREIQSQLNARS